MWIAPSLIVALGGFVYVWLGGGDEPDLRIQNTESHPRASANGKARRLRRRGSAPSSEGSFGDEPSGMTPPVFLGSISKTAPPHGPLAKPSGRCPAKACAGKPWQYGPYSQAAFTAFGLTGNPSPDGHAKNQGTSVTSTSSRLPTPGVDIVSSEA